MLKTFFESILASMKAGSSYFVGDIILRLLMALALSALISIIYRVVKHREDTNRGMTPSLILICITIAAAIMLIGDNLARSFGLVGAVSIIRFRSAVKSPMDMAFIFITIVIGMACGLGLYMIVLIFFILMIIVLLISWRTGFISNDPSFLITVSIFKPNTITRDYIKEVFKKKSVDLRFISSRGKKNYEVVQYFARIPIVEVDRVRDEFKELLEAGEIDLKIESK